MSDPTSTPTLHARVADARLWTCWLRALRAEIADQKDADALNPDLAAPESVHQTLVELLAVIDALPPDADHADLTLPPRRTHGDSLASLHDLLRIQSEAAPDEQEQPPGLVASGGLPCG